MPRLSWEWSTYNIITRPKRNININKMPIKTHVKNSRLSSLRWGTKNDRRLAFMVWYFGLSDSMAWLAGGSFEGLKVEGGKEESEMGNGLAQIYTLACTFNDDARWRRLVPAATRCWRAIANLRSWATKQWIPHNRHSGLAEEVLIVRHLSTVGLDAYC